MARVHDGYEFIVGSAHHNVYRVVVANLGDAVAKAICSAGSYFDDLRHEESSHVKIVNGHVAEDSSGNFDVLLGCRSRVAANDDQLLEIADFTVLHSSVDRGKVWVEPTVEAEGDLRLSSGNLFE